MGGLYRTDVAARFGSHLSVDRRAITESATQLRATRYAGFYSTLSAAGPTAVACLVLGSMPMSATPPTPPRLTVTTWPRALRSACTGSGRVLGTDRLPKSARSWPKELMKCVVEKRGA